MTIQEIIAELTAVDQGSLDSAAAGLTKAIADLTTFAAGVAVDPVATVTVLTAGGVSTEFVPKV